MIACRRREFLARSLRLAAGLGCCGVLPVVGCADAGETGPTALRIPLAELREGVRLRRELDGLPIEITRRGATVTARSLLCTHQGCEVAWHDDESTYVCPCHDGRFDAAGRPTYGPPRLPLRELPVVVEEDDVVIGD